MITGHRILRKCCPFGQSLDPWYNCRVKLSCDKQKTRDSYFQETPEDNFYELITLSLGLPASSVNTVWSNISCNLSREYEVVNILDISNGDDVVFVLTNNTLDHIIEDSNKLRSSVMATQYECLTAEGADVIAVVCEDEIKVTEVKPETNIGEEIRKCCPLGQALSRDLECASNIDRDLSSPSLPPRSLLSPDTLRPAPASPNTRLRMTGPGCEAGELVADLTRGVTSELAVTLDTRLVEYTCVDTDTGGQLLALRCLAPGHCEGCVSKCCPPRQVYSLHGGCVEATQEEQLWKHPQGGDPSYHHTFIDNFVRQKHFKRPGCDDVLVLEHEDDVYHLLEDGRLHHVDYGVTEKYCIDNVINDENYLEEIVLKCFSGKLHIRT